MVKYIYTVLIPSNMMTLICLYLHNSQLLEHKENIPLLKKCIFDLERRKYILWGWETFWEVLKENGIVLNLKTVRTRGPTKERNGNAEWRVAYWRIMKNYDGLGFNMKFSMYMNETWIHSVFTVTSVSTIVRQIVLWRTIAVSSG